MSDRIHLPQLLADTFDISRSEARRLINQGVVKLDGEQLLDFDPPAERLNNGTLLTLGRSRSSKLAKPRSSEQKEREES
jgi:ribosomal protein S4